MTQAGHAERGARGRFITLEGGEGAGKSTQVARLAERLQAHAGLAVLTTREPGGSDFAEEIRTLLLHGRAPRVGRLAEALLFYAARDDHLAATIRPALAEGRWVISDRFSDSTRAYQGAAGRAPGQALDTLDALVVDGARPDLTLILDIAPERGLARAEARHLAGQGAGDPQARDNFEARELAFHRRLREAFLAIARAEPERCVIIDADAGVDEVAERIWRAVEERLL